MALDGTDLSTYSPLMMSTKPKNKLASIDVLSNAYISASLFSLPPHVVS